MNGLRAAVLALLAATPAVAQTQEPAFAERPEVQIFIRDLVARHAFEESELQTVVRARPARGRRAHRDAHAARAAVAVLGDLSRDLDLERYRDRAHVSFIMTGTLDRDAYRSRFSTRSAKARGRSADRYLEHFDDILTIQNYLLAEAERHGLPIVDNVHFDTAVVSVIRSVIATLPPARARGQEGEAC